MSWLTCWRRTLVICLEVTEVASAKYTWNLDLTWICHTHCNLKLGYMWNQKLLRWVEYTHLRDPGSTERSDCWQWVGCGGRSTNLVIQAGVGDLALLGIIRWVTQHLWTLISFSLAETAVITQTCFPCSLVLNLAAFLSPPCSQAWPHDCVLASEMWWMCCVSFAFLNH